MRQVPASKIQDEQEVIRWFEEGRTYAWMQEEYLRKYHIETVPSMWGNFRRRRGLDRRITRDDDLLPWFVREEHRWAYPARMLRAEGRRRAGMELSKEDARRLPAWKRQLEKAGAVVHYDPDTDEGFHYVPRRPGVDVDLIRVPDHKTTQRRAAD